MLERILIAGAGGQGIVSAGKLLASVAIETVEHVTFFPAYGAEVRGGTSNCQLVLSSEEIASPVCEKFDSLLFMNRMSMERFVDYVAPGALVIANSSLCGEVGDDVLTIPATKAAKNQGALRAANFVLLGAYLGRKEIVAPERVRAEIKRVYESKGGAVVQSNLKAFETGLEMTCSSCRRNDDCPTN